MVKLTLECATQTVDVWTANRRVGPPLRLKGRLDTDNALLEASVAIDSTVPGSLGDGDISVSELLQQDLAEVLECGRAESLELGQQPRLRLVP